MRHVACKKTAMRYYKVVDSMGGSAFEKGQMKEEEKAFKRILPKNN
ncbi:hypothetical protein EPICR_40133 [Candidatus Desulfarcum epimagneticum]|uniref:Uncharacterized protein n=1 Tax=uncultured Desulfobacteraceae bacterium TaxID=218296 RepID=A0A484HMM7_9BACT|nr:hypothetical protein EPICR_40133 [uncultured Desulfobacteraceae bacterium]